jgi:hypothetical protein
MHQIVVNVTDRNKEWKEKFIHWFTLQSELDAYHIGIKEMADLTEAYIKVKINGEEI